MVERVRRNSAKTVAPEAARVATPIATGWRSSSRHGLRRLISAGTAGFILALLVASSALGSSSASVVLGREHLLQGGQGWGTAHPSLIFNGGDPSGRAWDLRWSGWGSPVAEAHGLTWIFRPDGGYFGKPGAIELRASVIGRCTPSGPRAYTRLEARVAARPGGPLGKWFVWGGWKSTCVGP